MCHGGGPNAVCPEGAIDVSERGTFTGSTCGGDGEADSCGGSGSPGVYFVIGPGTYTWTLTPDFSIQYDAYSCGSGNGGCESPDHSYVHFGVTHYLVVASTSPFSCGHFTLTIE